jgi:hypothetical protein
MACPSRPLPTPPARVMVVVTTLATVVPMGEAAAAVGQAMVVVGSLVGWVACPSLWAITRGRPTA